MIKNIKDKIKNKIDYLISFLPEKRNRYSLIAVTVYALALTYLIVWMSSDFTSTLEDWEENTPQITVDLKKPSANTIETPDFSQSDPVYGNKYISLIISNLGTDANRTNDALIAMPKEVAFAFSPYSYVLQNWINRAIAKNHEAYVLIPMESALYPTKDPGPKALSPRLSDKENEYYINWSLNRSHGASGVMNFMGSRFLTDKSRLPYIFDIFKEKNYIFIENPVIKHSIAKKTAEKTDVPYISINLKIDDIVDEDHIKQKLKELEQIANRDGYAVGIAESYPLTLHAIQSWVKNLENQGIKLSPLKDLVLNIRYRDDKQQK